MSLPELISQVHDAGIDTHGMLEEMLEAGVRESRAVHD